MTRLLRILAAVLVVAPMSAYSATPPALPGDSVYQLPATLTDSAGRTVAWKDLRGTPRVATMFYTSCKYICQTFITSLEVPKSPAWPLNPPSMAAASSCT